MQTNDRMKTHILWDVKPCRLVNNYRSSGRHKCLHIQCQARQLQGQSSPKRVGLVWPWIWRHDSLPKRLQLFTNRQGIISHNIWIFSSTSVRTSNVADAKMRGLRFSQRCCWIFLSSECVTSRVLIRGYQHFAGDFWPPLHGRLFTILVVLLWRCSSKLFTNLGAYL
jgi:hypothetical protein